MNRYLRRDFHHVDGYTNILDGRLFDVFLEAQSAAGITGSMAEIGVHHGRSFFILAGARRPGEKALAVDVFKDDAIYQDPLGMGRGARFHQNCQRLGVTLDASEIFSGLSTSLDAGEIARRVGPVRFFSVDGGHRYDDVRHDLRLAAAALAPRGMIVADDFMNAQWPEVSLAVVDWLREPGNKFAPFLSTPSKLSLCARADRDFYRGAAERLFAGGGHIVTEAHLYDDAYYFARLGPREKLRDLARAKLIALRRRSGERGQRTTSPSGPPAGALPAAK